MVKKVSVFCFLLAFGMALGQSGEQYTAQQEQIKLALRSADDCEKRGDWKPAKSILWGANETYPNDSGITYRLGLLQLKDKEYAAALRTFRSTRHDLEWDRRRYSYVG
jgi:hypothetical protein